MNYLKLSLLLCIGLFSTGSLAASYSDYIGLDASMVTVENEIGESLAPENFRLRLGASIAPYFDLEGHLGLTVNSDESFQASWDADFAALFLKGYMPISRYAALYGMGGFAGVALTETVGHAEFVDERYGFAYGGGIEVVLSETVDLSLDYVNYLHDEGLLSSVTAVSVGLKFYY